MLKLASILSDCCELVTLSENKKFTFNRTDHNSKRPEEKCVAACEWHGECSLLLILAARENCCWRPILKKVIDCITHTLDWWSLNFWHYRPLKHFKQHIIDVEWTVAKNTQVYFSVQVTLPTNLLSFGVFHMIWCVGLFLKASDGENCCRRPLPWNNWLHHTLDEPWWWSLPLPPIITF